MLKPQRTRRRGGVEIEIGLTLVLILVGIGWMIRNNPVQLDGRADATVVAPPAEGQTRADVLVVLPTVPEAHSFDAMSFDQAWLNVIEQEIGPVRVVESSQLTRSVLDPCAWAIIPKRAASQFDPTQTQFVRNWVEDGGTVILEQPEGPWRALLGQSIGMARARETRRITSFDGALSRGEMRADILEMPLQTTIVPYAPSGLTRGRDYQVLLEIDGQPGVVSLHIGRGRILLLLFDFGRAAVQVTQGLPNGDFTLRFDPERETGATTADLVADPALFGTHIPFVDLLQRNLLYLAEQHHPIGRLWAYPGTQRGALLVGHTESGYGEASAYMPTWEHAHEVASSMFVVTRSMSPEALARLGRVEADLQLQWTLADDPRVPMSRFGIGKFHPIQRPMNLAEQAAALNADLNPYGPFRATRTRDGRWPNHYLAAFGALDAAGVALDSSYGPPDATRTDAEDAGGYLYGTGRPFRPLDLNGNRFRVRELPVVIDAAAPGYSVQRVRNLIVDSSEGYHTTIAADWPPNVMADRPSFDAIDGWQSAFELAASQELWVATYAEYLAFIDARQASHVESSFSREERRLTITAEIAAVEPAAPEDEVLSPSVAFPTRFEGRPVDRLIVDGNAMPAASLALSGDRVLHVLPLEEGEHRIQVIYGSPVEASPPL